MSHAQKEGRKAPTPQESRGPLNEVELIEQARNGDESAFRRLYDDHVDRVFRLCFRMAGQEDLARDFTQEAFIRAYEKLGQFRGDAAFGTWLHSIATSVSLNGLRKLKRQGREQPMETASFVPENGRPPDPYVRERLHRAVNGLPEIYRSVFVLYDVEGFSHQEIAEMLDVAEGTSKARLSRARSRLRDALGDIAQEYMA